MAKPVRTRIAPSPTGNLHVGTARTALFNELFARQHGGEFIVRSEDTDAARSRPEYEATILEGLAWLGLSWSEGPDRGGAYGPYRQSERTAIYRSVLEQLLEKGAAYQVPDSAAIKLRVQPREVQFTDLVRGPVTVHTDTWGGDFVIARSLESPVFHFVVVVDDALMHISHVIRGEDHLTNTARHILLQEALGYERPEYAHLPLLLDEQRRKLSKRAAETNLLAYRDEGYVAAALLNYLALLGWNPKDDQEFFTHDELIERFSLDGVHKGGAIFSVTKLTAVNKHYLRQLTGVELLEAARPFMTAAGYSLDDTDYWIRAVATEQERVGTLAELPDKLEYFRADWQPTYAPELLVWRTSTPEDTKNHLERLLTFVNALAETDFVSKMLESRLLTWIDAEGWGRGEVLWPLRVALTGMQHSPGPFEVAALLGKSITVERIQAAKIVLDSQA